MYYGWKPHRDLLAQQSLISIIVIIIRTSPGLRKHLGCSGMLCFRMWGLNIIVFYYRPQFPGAPRPRNGYPKSGNIYIYIYTYIYIYIYTYIYIYIRIYTHM